MAEIHHAAGEGKDLTNSSYWNSSWVGRRSRWTLSSGFSDWLRYFKTRSFARLLQEQVDLTGVGEIQVCELGLCARGDSELIEF